MLQSPEAGISIAMDALKDAERGLRTALYRERVAGAEMAAKMVEEAGHRELAERIRLTAEIPF